MTTLSRYAVGVLITATTAIGASAAPAYRCTAAGGVTYQDAPCPSGAVQGRVEDPEATRETRAHANAERASRTAVRRATDAHKSDAPRATPPEPPSEPLRAAFDRVRIGMTLADMGRTHPGLLGGSVRTLEAVGHKYEWRTYDLDPGAATIGLRDGVIQNIQR